MNAHPPAIRHFEEAVDALLQAYRTGTPEAMQRHWEHTWHRRNHATMRTYVQLDLGRPSVSAGQEDDISLDDARWLVAREHGFQTWNALLKFYRELTVSPLSITGKPIRVLASRTADPDETSGWRSRDWHAVLSHLQTTRATVIDAAEQMTDAMLKDLASIDHLQVLNLSGSRGVTDAGIIHLAAMGQLRHLDLSGTGVTDRALELIASMPQLESISLARTGISDSGVAHLAHCDQLVDVNLQGTATGDGALRALTGKPRLSQLRSGNAVTDIGLAYLRDMPIFRSWHGGEPKVGLLSYDASPNYLLLRGTFTDGGMSQLADLAGLFALNLDASELRITSDGLIPLIDLPHLEWLAIDAKDDCLAHVARMPRLRFLGCQDTVATDDGFLALSQSPTIEYIWGRRCYNLRTNGFSALTRMPSLRGLAVSCKNVDDRAIARLPEFPSLRELMPMDIPDPGYRHIARCAGLESLVLMYCRDTSDAATEHLVALPQLKKYFASYTQITDRTPELLSQILTLESITLSGCGQITDAGVTHLARLPHLQSLAVSGPQLTGTFLSSFPPHIRVSFQSDD